MSTTLLQGMLKTDLQGSFVFCDDILLQAQLPASLIPSRLSTSAWVSL